MEGSLVGFEVFSLFLLGSHLSELPAPQTMQLFSADLCFALTLANIVAWQLSLPLGTAPASQSNTDPQWKGKNILQEGKELA